MKSTWDRKEKNTKRIAIAISIALHILLFVALSGDSNSQATDDSSQTQVEQVAGS